MMEEVKKLKKENKEGMEKQEDLMNSAKVLQNRISEGKKVKIFRRVKRSSFALQATVHLLPVKINERS